MHWGGEAGEQMIRGSFTLPGKVARYLWRHHSLLQTCSFATVKPQSAWLYGGYWRAVSFRADLARVTNMSCQWQTSPQAAWLPGSVCFGSRWSLVGRSRACRVKEAQPPAQAPPPGEGLWKITKWHHYYKSTSVFNSALTRESLSSGSELQTLCWDGWRKSSQLESRQNQSIWKLGMTGLWLWGCEGEHLSHTSH